MHNRDKISSNKEKDTTASLSHCHGVLRQRLLMLSVKTSQTVCTEKVQLPTQIFEVCIFSPEQQTVPPPSQTHVIICELRILYIKEMLRSSIVMMSLP